MSKDGWTPGPWAVQNPMGEDVGLWVVQDGLEARQWSSIAIVVEDEDGTARDEGGRFIGRTEQRANARLIAAAPDLVEALIRALNYLENTENEFGIVLDSAEMCRAALSKARGENPNG